jgi:hypothetical protein
MIGATDFSTPETRAEVDYLHRAIEYAPADPGPLAASLVGWWTALGNWVCARCAGRIMARGCRFPKSEPKWRDDVGPRGVCCCCDK